MSAQNLTLLTDLYELTMMQGYFETQEYPPLFGLSRKKTSNTTV